MNNSEQPAFSNPGSEYGPGSARLTKREYFAAMAMQGFCSNPNVSAFKDTSSSSDGIQFYAACSIKMADELLKQLES